MLEVNAAVIVLVPKKYLAFITVITACLLALGMGIVYKSRQSYITVRDTKFTSEVMKTPAQRQQGLSGRDSLPGNRAMIFVSDNSTRQCFWMKDMQFAIDMVWLDANKKVVAIEHNISPSSYPTNFCHDGKYVIEFVAGTAARIGLQPGDQAHL